MSWPDPVGDGEAARHEGPPAQPRTPASIVVALLAFTFAIGAHLMAVDAVANNKTEGYQYLVTMVSSFLSGGVATVVGIVCTIVGARRGPRSGATTTAIVLAVILSLPLLFVVGLAGLLR